jgi:hypothetical protein
MTSEYGACALRAGLAKLHAGVRMHTPTLSGTDMQARTHAEACTHRRMSYCFSLATVVS